MDRGIDTGIKKWRLIILNNIYICLGKYAKTPFFIKFSEIYIYSIEELCYYFMENIYVIDSNVMTMELVEWIKEECGIVDLAEQLQPLVRKKSSISLFVSTILEYMKLYDEQEIRKAVRIIREHEFLSPFERWKKKAENEYRMGRFHQAQRIYEYLLTETDIEDTQTRALLLYNIGSVLAMDFAFEAAAEYYLESYQLQQSRKTRIAYIFAIKYLKNDFEYGVFCREHEEWEEDFHTVDKMSRQTQQMWETSKSCKVIQQLKDVKRKGEIADYQKMREDLLFQLKKDFRRQTV